MTTRGKPPRCHPERKHHGKGLCHLCYKANWLRNFSGDKKLYYKKRQLQTRYGISIADFDALLKSQKDRCAICGRKEKYNNRSLAVDHDHKTKKIRGLLCVRCNAGLGNFCDDPKIIKKAFKFLTRRKYG